MRAGRGGRPWGLISSIKQCLQFPKMHASLPGVQTGPLFYALGKAPGVDASSPGTPNLTEPLLPSLTPLRIHRGQDRPPTCQPMVGWY